jgi:ankyrin repeat protein
VLLTAVAEVLIEHGASLTTANANGWTAHQIADFKVTACTHINVLQNSLRLA